MLQGDLWAISWFHTRTNQLVCAHAPGLGRIKEIESFLFVGYHATDAASFAEAFHQALSLPAPEALIMRQRARALAIERFSTDRFEKGWARGWELAVRGIRA